MEIHKKIEVKKILDEYDTLVIRFMNAGVEESEARRRVSIMQKEKYTEVQ